MNRLSKTVWSTVTIILVACLAGVALLMYGSVYNGQPPRDDTKALQTYREAAEHGNAQAAADVAHYYSAQYTRDHNDRDKFEADKWWHTEEQLLRDQAETGDGAAQETLGGLYWNLTGEGPKRDLVEAYYWYSVAARNNGDRPKDSLASQKMAASAAAEVAKLLTPEQIEAVDQRVKNKSPTAPNSRDTNLGDLFIAASEGDMKAYAVLKSKAEGGNARAQYWLGDLLLGGSGVKEDDAKALIWLLSAAGKGDVKAQSLLGTMYWEGGSGVARDYPEALKWLRKAAEQGDGRAQRKLSGMYYTGDGVKQNLVESYFWRLLDASLAEDTETPEDIAAINKVMRNSYDEGLADASKHLTPAQITELKKRVKEWKLAHPTVKRQGQ